MMASASVRRRAAVLRCAACRCSRPNASRIAPFAVEPISASAIVRRRRCSCRCLTSRCHSPNASRRTDVAVVRPSSVSAPFCRARRAFVACTVCAHRVYHTRVAPRFVCDRKIDIAWRRARAPFCSCMCRSHDAKASRCRAVPDVRVSSENAMACDASRRRRSAARSAAND